jgi:hypothetical protein
MARRAELALTLASGFLETRRIVALTTEPSFSHAVFAPQMALGRPVGRGLGARPRVWGIRDAW